MKGNAKDYVSTAQQFFTAYDAHDVDGMLALCAHGALGRYAPYGRESVVPIRGWGIFNSFPGCGGERSMCMAAVADLLSKSIMPAGLGLAAAIMTSWGHKHLSARMSHFDIEMANAVRDLQDFLAQAELRALRSTGRYPTKR